MNIENFLLIGAIVATVLFILKVSLPIDSGTEVTGDFGDMADSDASFSLFTIEGILAFLMCSGWMGWISRVFLSYSGKKTIIVAVISGLVALFFYAFLISKIKKLEHAPKSDKKELIGKTGKAYTHFSPSGQGQIEIEFNSRLEVLDAKNNSDIEIQSFEAIKVVRVEDDIIYIEKL